MSNEHIKLETVKHQFNQTDQYLKGNSSIMTRINLVHQLLGSKSFGRVLDLGCGNGTIGLSLMDKAGELTLLDVSENMINVARQHTPETYKNIDYIVGDALTYHSDSRFDLIICIGVAAHVELVDKLIANISANLKDGGYLLIQFTEKNTVHGWMLYTFFNKGFNAYKVNKTSRKQIFASLKKHGITPEQNKMYSEASFGLGKISNKLAIRFKLLTSKLFFLRFFFSERIWLCRKQ